VENRLLKKHCGLVSFSTFQLNSLPLVISFHLFESRIENQNTDCNNEDVHSNKLFNNQKFTLNPTIPLTPTGPGGPGCPWNEDDK
jgi:hypothetical protein